MQCLQLKWRLVAHGNWLQGDLLPRLSQGSWQMRKTTCSSSCWNLTAGPVQKVLQRAQPWQVSRLSLGVLTRLHLPVRAACHGAAASDVAVWTLD